MAPHAHAAFPSTLDRAYSQLINALGDTAQDHADFADGIAAEVTDILKSTEKRYEETNRRQLQFYQKLYSDRDKIYADRLKVCFLSVLIPSEGDRSFRLNIR